MSDLALPALFPAFAGSEPLAFFLQSFVSLFVVVDPIGNVPIFLTFLNRFPDQERRAIERRAALVACFALLLVTLGGNTFFKLLGISIYSFRIAGGVLLTMVSIEMLYGKKTGTESSADEEHAYAGRNDISVLPLAIPLLSGPGAFTTGIVLFDTAGSVANRMVLLFAIATVYLFSYVILSRSRVVLKYLRKTGMTVVIRIMGLMLLSLAMQFIVTGLGEAFRDLK